MSALWTLDAMAAAMRADRAGDLPDDVPGISIDSRTLGKGDAFFAVERVTNPDRWTAALVPGCAP